MQDASIALAIFGVTFYLARVCDYNNYKLIWATLFAPFLIILWWIGGMIYINSSYCPDIQICDGGGMLAFSAGIAIQFVIVLALSIAATIAFVFWRRIR